MRQQLTVNEARNAIKADKNLEKTATVKPGDYQLGSPESRAAARSVLEAEETELPVVVYKFDIGDGKPIILPIYPTKRD